MSPPEAMLWEKLRGGATGAKFRRQHPVGPYVVDFYCREAGLVIEIDGEVHDRADRPQRDETRLRFLREQGYRVVRIAARRVMADVDAVTDAIATLVATPPPACGWSPPRAGEDIAPLHARSPSPSVLGEDLEG
ncbi:endonuclease domain-containing protein [Sphingomonas panni]